jgi:glycosyltransferase involved in cell wall biosynthesis
LKKNQIQTSIIITTFNREKNIFELIGLLNKQLNILKKTIEIIICDSNSKKRLSILSYIKQFHGLKIIYYNCKINHQAFKRNYGIKNSAGKYKILIDDDCFPDNNFLKDFIKILQLNRKRSLYCGLVKYVQFQENARLIKYRQSRVYYLNKKENVPHKNFLTMNMGLNSCVLPKIKIIFNNKFRNYGFEDFEFAYRFKKNYYKLLQIKSLVYHRDNRNFDDFLKKYNFLGCYGIIDIIQINLIAAKDLIYYKIEINFIINFFLKIPFARHFLHWIERFVSFIERKTSFYFPLLYNIGIAIAYLKGVTLRSYYREKKIFNLRYEWYK